MPLTVTKPLPILPKPWKVGGKTATEIELREPTLKDILAAEADANPAHGLNAYYVAMACQTMVRAGDYTGPFTIAQFGSMSRPQYEVLRTALREAEELGEEQPPSQAETS